MKNSPKTNILSILTLLVMLFNTPVSAAGQPDINNWMPLGDGLNGNVNTIAVNGSDIYAGGVFTDAGGNADADYIAKWDGTTWSALGAGLNGTVTAIAISGTDVYVGGEFTSVGAIANTSYIAKWDGTNWSALGTGLNNQVNAIAVKGTDVYVGGMFTSAGGVAKTTYIAKWDGANWSALENGLSGAVAAIAISGTDVYAGLSFTHDGNSMMKWNGTTWSSLHYAPIYGISIYSIGANGTELFTGNSTHYDLDGDVAYEPLHQISGYRLPCNFLGRYFNYLQQAPIVSSLTMNGTDLYVGGNFVSLDSANADKNYIARCNALGWSALSATPLNAPVKATAISGANLIVGGSFTDAGGNAGGDHITMIVAPAKPVTLTLPSMATLDGVVLESSENSKMGGTLNNVAPLVIGDDATKKQYRSILSFNTGSIPANATITRLTLILKEKPETNLFGFLLAFNGAIVDIKTGFFGSKRTLQSTDFESKADASTPVNFDVPNIAHVYHLELIAIKDFINKQNNNSGLTQLRLRLKLDDNNDTFANIAKFYSGDALNEADRPQLVITYSP